MQNLGYNFKEFIFLNVAKKFAHYVEKNSEETLTSEKIMEVIYGEPLTDKISKEKTVITNSKLNTNTIKNKRKPCKWKFDGESCTKTTSDASGFCASCKRKKDVQEILNNEKRLKDQELKYSTEISSENTTLKLELIDLDTKLYKDLDTQALIIKTDDNVYEVLGLNYNNDIIDLTTELVDKYKALNITYVKKNDIRILHKHINLPSLVPKI